MKRHLWLIQLLIILNFPFISTGQNSNFRFRNLTTVDGISDVFIRDILIDKEGFLWLATQDGLNQYNGYNFKNFKHNSSDTTSLPENFIFCLAEDSSGNIWAGTKERGLGKYIKKLDYFKTYSTKNNLQSNAIQKIFTDHHGGVWVGTANGLSKYNPVTDKFINYRIAPGSSFNEIVYCFDELNQQTLLAGTSFGGIFYFDSTLNKFENFNYYSGDSLVPLRIDTKAILAEDTVIWFGNYADGLFRYSIKTKQLKNYVTSNNVHSIGSNEIKAIYRDSRNNLWIGCINGGASLYNAEKDNFTRFYHYIGDDLSLLSNSISEIKEDKYHNVWFICDLAGLSYFNYNNLFFDYYYNIPNNPQSISSKSVNCFCEDNRGHLWIGTGKGINLYSDQKFTTYLCPEGNNLIGDMAFDGNKLIYIAGWGNGLKSFNIDTKKYTDLSTINNLDNKLSNNNLKGLGIDSSGNIWLAAHCPDGINIYDPKHRQYYNKLNPGPYDSLIFKVDYPVDNFQDSRHRIWMVTYTGLFMYDGSFHTFLYNPNDTNSLSANYNYCIYEDNNKNIWVGNTGGLDKIEEVNHTFRITRFNGKFDFQYNVKGILQDNKGQFWLSTNQGIIYLNPNTGKYRIFDELNGLQGKDFKERASYMDSSGTMYFGGSQGFNSFKPGDLYLDTTPPDVYVTDLLIFNKSQRPNANNSILKKAIIETDKLTLSYDQSVISFEYVAIGNLSNNNNTYAYKMEGFDKEWHHVGTERKATYTNLNPGTYVFKVKAANADDIWNQRGKSITIKINPPWYKTLLFRILAIVSIIGLILVIYKWRVSELQQQKRNLEDEVNKRTHELQQSNEELETIVSELQETQTQLIQSEKMASIGILTSGIAHEINNPLNFILAGKTLLEDFFNEKLPEYSKDITPLLEMLDEGVSRASGIVKSLNHFNRTSSVYDEKCDLPTIVENCLMILNTQIDSDIQISKTYTPQNYTLLGNDGELHQVILNILTNAIQAIQKQGTININTHIEGNRIIITISDSGQGISEENLKKITDPFFTTKAPGKGTGLGMSIAYKIIKKHNGSIEYISKLGQGTQVVLTFPVEL